MTLGERIRRLRHKRDWSQTEAAKRMGIHQKQMSGYERNQHVPSTDVLIRMAKAFDCSLDYLAFEDRDETRNGAHIADPELLEKIQLVDKLPEGDKDAVKAVLDSFILKNRFQRLAVGEAAGSGPAAVYLERISSGNPETLSITVRAKSTLVNEQFLN